MARMLARLGDLRRAVKSAEEVGSRQLFRDVAAILESQGHSSEAAMMYERADLPDRAAAVYIKSKNWVKVGIFPFVCVCVCACMDIYLIYVYMCVCNCFYQLPITYIYMITRYARLSLVSPDANMALRLERF